jgi:ABC-type lipoprotein release transport system permease subunit
MGWDKPASQFSQYLQEQEAGHRTGLVAEWEGCVAGYLTILWESQPDEGPGRPAGRGLGAALVAGRILEGFLYQVSPRDPLVLLSAALALVGVAFLASYVPARRASRVDPVQTLNAE